MEEKAKTWWLLKMSLAITQTKETCLNMKRNLITRMVFSKINCSVIRLKMLWALIIQNKHQKCKLAMGTLNNRWGKTIAFLITSKTNQLWSWHLSSQCKMRFTVIPKLWCFIRKCFKILSKQGPIQTCILKLFRPQLYKKDKL